VPIEDEEQFDLNPSSATVISMPDVADRHLVLYDGECPLCVFQSRVLSWLDWLNQLRLLPLADAEVQALKLGISREDLLEAIHCVTRHGQIHRGARCIRFVGMRLPLLLPLALMLWIPGVIWIAEKVYQAISRNRLVLSRMFGCKEACAILPPRQRTARPAHQHLK